MGTIVDPSEILLKLGLGDSATDNERAVVAMAIVTAEGAISRHLKYYPALKSHTEYYPMQDYTTHSREAVWEANDQEAYVRYLAEAATNELQLRHIPVRGNPSIDLRIDYDARSGTRSANAFAAGTQQTEGDDFWMNYDARDKDGNRICIDGIARSIGRWPSVPGSVKIIYTGGYSAAEFRNQDTPIEAVAIWESALIETVKRAKADLINAKKDRLGHVPGPFTSESLGDYSYSLYTGHYQSWYGGDFDILPETRERLEEYVNYGWILAS